METIIVLFYRIVVWINQDNSHPRFKSQWCGFNPKARRPKTSGKVDVSAGVLRQGKEASVSLCRQSGKGNSRLLGGESAFLFYSGLWLIG